MLGANNTVRELSMRNHTTLSRATGLALPEKDYPRLTTLASAVAYLAEKHATLKPE